MTHRSRPSRCHPLPLLLALVALSTTGAAPLPPIAEPATSVRLPGKLVWFDLVTDDAAAAQKFYGAVFGWTFVRNGDYTVISAGPEKIAGIYRRDIPRGGAPATHWLTFVSVPNTAAAAAYAEANGGKTVIRPKQMPGRGEQAILRDPAGALFGVVTSETGDPADEPARAGEIIWADIFVRQPSRVLAFYRGLAGYKTSRASEERTVLSSGGFHRAGIKDMPEGDHRPGWLPYVQVEDVAAAVQRVTAAGGKIHLAPSPEHLGGNVAIVEDTRGGVIGIVKWTGSSATASR